MTITELMDILDIPSSVISEVMKYQKTIEQLPQNQILSFTKTDTWETTWNALKQQNDPHGYYILCCMLNACLYTYQRYQAKHIPFSIFIDTMKCFPRFIKEHKISFGEYGFDRDFWVGRQLSMQLFRIGTLEYEIDHDAHCISIHIPSDAILSKQACLSSISLAKQFFHTYEPIFDAYPYRCCSWLLSPALKELLPNNSSILQFQQMFSIIDWNQENEEFMMWVYHTFDQSYDRLPQQTTLQVNMKQYLQKGGKIGEATGEFIY